MINMKINNFYHYSNNDNESIIKNCIKELLFLDNKILMYKFFNNNIHHITPKTYVIENKTDIDNINNIFTSSKYFKTGRIYK